MGVRHRLPVGRATGYPGQGKNIRGLNCGKSIVQTIITPIENGEAWQVEVNFIDPDVAAAANLATAAANVATQEKNIAVGAKEDALSAKDAAVSQAGIATSAAGVATEAKTE